MADTRADFLDMSNWGVLVSDWIRVEQDDAGFVRLVTLRPEERFTEADKQLLREMKIGL